MAQDARTAAITQGDGMKQAKTKLRLKVRNMCAVGKSLGLSSYSLAKVCAAVCEATGEECPSRKEAKKAIILSYIDKNPKAVAAARAQIRAAAVAGRNHSGGSETAKPALTYKRINPIGKPHPDYKRDDSFYASREWKELRYMALKLHGPSCQCCGATAAQGAQIHVDHVEPIYKRPDLKMQLSNLQILCSDCNQGKGAWDNTDWREHFRSI